MKPLLNGFISGALLSFSFFPLTAQPAADQSSLDKLAITGSGASGGFAFTNKRHAFFYGETHAKHTSPWHGYYLSRQRVLDDYSLMIDGQMRPRNEAIRVTVYPDFIEREYPDGVREELRIVDSLAVIAVHVFSPKPVELGLVPWIAGVRNGQDHVVRHGVGRTLIGTPADPEFWIAIHGNGFTPVSRESHEEGRYSDVLLYSPRAKEHVLAFAFSKSEREAETLAASYSRKANRYAKERRARMEALLALTPVKTADKEYDKALAWAKLSLDALIMDDGRKGIYAGLPWFDNYWGRDTFISLSGALLVTGQFERAREILRTFATLQQRDTTSPNYGRIPNVINPGDVSYNTADGTPRFVIIAKEYVERSGDSLFLMEIYPSILRAIDGTIRYHTDSLAFLTHGDSETWMDAAGPQGAWSPRGNRANDIQALWSAQLEAGIWFATQVGDAMSAQSWQGVSRILKGGFARHFVIEGAVTDHLNPDGTPDRQLRPNQIFAASMLAGKERASVLRTVVQELTYPYGVASLSQEDPDFHPFHNHPPFYPKDAAYHNGTVWTWLQGVVISELCDFGRENMAYSLTKNTVHQILHRDAVGTQSELLDALPHKGEMEPRASGTFSQAWNLAEFIRNFYDDYLGVRLTRYDHVLRLEPRIPEALGDVHSVINLEGRAVPVSIMRTHDRFDVTIDAVNLRNGGKGKITIPLPRTNHLALVRIQIRPGARLTLSATKAGVLLMVNGETEMVKHQTVEPLGSLLPEELHFAEPSLPEDSAVLKGPVHPLLPHIVIKETNPAAMMLVAAIDDEGDDRGTGQFVYPTNPAHVDGSFDLTGFKVDFDDRNLYFGLTFRALSDPGWHPEYGFQMTYVAIAIDTDGKPGSGRSQVGHNSRFVLPDGFLLDRLILIGGGIQVEDHEGRTLAAYMPSPQDVVNPLGNTGDGTISFAIPRQFFSGKLNPEWRFSVLVGGQDDHGGAGLGEFRSVEKTGGEWNGGGRISESDPNVYDTLFYPHH